MCALTIDDFSPSQATCELRYKNAYLVFDRTGQIIQDLRESFTDIQPIIATPQQTAFTATEGHFQLELGACRFTGAQADTKLETFAKQCKTFFDAVTEHLQITVFTRIGFRYVLRKEYKTEAESRIALGSMQLANLKPDKRFNSSDSPTEVMFRWEDEQVGATVRLKADTTEIKVAAPVELRESALKLEKKIIGLTLDIDYYTVAPVEREQWDAQEWLPQKLRMMKKEADSIVQNGGR